MTPKMRLLIVALILSASAHAEQRWYKSAHFWSEVALVAAESLDTTSSLRPGQEQNRFLASQSRFQVKGVVLKWGAVGAYLAVERTAVRRSPELKDAFTAANFALAGASGGVSLTNWRKP